jgi:hypothetical protein
MYAGHRHLSAATSSMRWVVIYDTYAAGVIYAQGLVRARLERCHL